MHLGNFKKVMDGCKKVSAMDARSPVGKMNKNEAKMLGMAQVIKDLLYCPQVTSLILNMMENLSKTVPMDEILFAERLYLKTVKRRQNEMRKR